MHIYNPTSKVRIINVQKGYPYRGYVFDLLYIRLFLFIFLLKICGQNSIELFLEHLYMKNKLFIPEKHIRITVFRLYLNIIQNFYILNLCLMHYFS